MSKILVLKNEAPPVGAGNSMLSDLFGGAIGSLTGAQVRQRAEKLGLTDPEREKFSAAQKRARMFANLYGVGRGLGYLGQGYLRGRLRPIESFMQGVQGQQMASATAEPFFTRRALSNIEAAREGQEQEDEVGRVAVKPPVEGQEQEDEVGRVAVKPSVEETLRHQTPAETKIYPFPVRERPIPGSVIDELLQYYPSSRPVVEERQMTFSPEITGGLPSLSQPTVQPTPTMTGKQVGVLSQRPTADLAEPTVTSQQQPTVTSQQQPTDEQLSMLMDEKFNRYDKTNFQDRKDQAQQNQPDLTGGASGSTIMGG